MHNVLRRLRALERTKKTYPYLQSGFVDDQQRKYFTLRWVLRHPREACVLICCQPGKLSRFILRRPRLFITGRLRKSRPEIYSSDSIKNYSPRIQQIHSSLLTMHRFMQHKEEK